MNKMNLSEALELRKARSHKYIRKEGKRYIYKEGEKKKHAKIDWVPSGTEKKGIKLPKGHTRQVISTSDKNIAENSGLKIVGGMHSSVGGYLEAAGAKEHWEAYEQAKEDRRAKRRKGKMLGEEVEPGIFENKGEGGVVTCRSKDYHSLVDYISKTTGDSTEDVEMKIVKEKGIYKYTESEDMYE